MSTLGDRSGRSRRHAPLARALAAGLLLLVLYGSVVEAVHRHGNLPFARGNASASAFNNRNGEDTQGKSLYQNGECLICQLHQQFSAGLFHAPLRLPAPPVEPATAHAVAVSYLSTASTPCRGRAPPLTSLI